jgi:hypothetical protein
MLDCTLDFDANRQCKKLDTLYRQLCLVNAIAVANALLPRPLFYSTKYRYYETRAFWFLEITDYC